MSFNNDWRKSSLENEVKLNYGKGLPKRKRNDGDIPVYGSSGLSGYHDDYLIKGPGIIIGRKGTIGKVTFASEDFWPIDTTYYLGLNNNKNDLKFWYYYLKNLPLENMNSHSAVPGINRDQVYKLEVLVPPLNEQKEIANILSSLDKKIKLNNQMNQTLEKIAQAIYKNWFVDFEPFQDEEFIKSELGMIPKDWEIIKLDNFFPIKTGKENAGIAVENGDYPFFTCSQDIRRANQYSFNDSAILLAGNGDFNVKWYRGKFEAYQRTYVLIPYEKKYFSFLYYTLDFFLDELTKGHKGSVINYLTKDMIESFKIVVPKDKEILKIVSGRLNQINLLIENNNKMNLTLQRIRDALLPKLMSGEIRVESFEKERG